MFLIFVCICFVFDLVFSAELLCLQFLQFFYVFLCFCSFVFVFISFLCVFVFLLYFPRNLPQKSWKFGKVQEKHETIFYFIVLVAFFVFFRRNHDILENAWKMGKRMSLKLFLHFLQCSQKSWNFGKIHRTCETICFLKFFCTFSRFFMKIVKF